MRIEITIEKTINDKDYIINASADVRKQMSDIGGGYSVDSCEVDIYRNNKIIKGTEFNAIANSLNYEDIETRLVEKYQENV